MWIRLNKVSAVAAGAASGIGVYLYSKLTDYNRKYKNSYEATPVFTDKAIWDYNWDSREPTSLINECVATPEEEKQYQKKIDELTPKYKRNIILVRHCEYLNIKGSSDSDNHLTKLGHQQAKYTGERLKSLGIKWQSVIASTMTRAQETANIITSVLGCEITEYDSLIKEANPEKLDSVRRIEEGFHKYFYRGDVNENVNSYILIIGHANVIRYMVCRVLQISPRVWDRFVLNHGSITWISILPSGRVLLRSLGDSGHIPTDMITSRAQRQ